MYITPAEFALAYFSEFDSNILDSLDEGVFSSVNNKIIKVVALFKGIPEALSYNTFKHPNIIQPEAWTITSGNNYS